MLDIKTHRTIMYNILQDIFTQTFAKKLAFKWWTATYFLYWLDRFSTDLDFDVLWEIDNLDQKIIDVLKKYWTIKKKNKIILSYKKEQDNIKIDINRKIRKNNHYQIMNFFGTDIQVQDAETIFSNKLVALTERNTNRDIYDVHFFMKNAFKIDEKLIQERTWKNSIELFKIILKKLKSLNKNYKILDGLWEVLDNKQKSFVKQKMLQDLIGRISLEIM